MLKIEKSCQEGKATLYLTGDLDLSSVEDFRKALTDIGEAELSICLDLAGLDFLDSTGVGALISELKKFKQSSNEIIIKRFNEDVREVLEILGVLELFPDVFQEI